MSRAMSISSPKLSKTGYICIPSISCLQLLSEAELSMVPNFSISREGYGKVEWDGYVDLCGADLDLIVRIEHKSITIHGTELNRSKILTIENIFPKCSNNKTHHENFDKKYLNQRKKWVLILLNMTLSMGVGYSEFLHCR